MNVHLLSHLAETVRSWGPLWAYSCFSFEGMNGYMKTFFHGTREMSTQVNIYTTVVCTLSIYGCQSDVLIFVAVLTIVCISRMHFSTKFNGLLFYSMYCEEPLIR